MPRPILSGGACAAFEVECPIAPHESATHRELEMAQLMERQREKLEAKYMPWPPTCWIKPLLKTRPSALPSTRMPSPARVAGLL